MDEINYSFKPTGQISVFNFKPNYNISFHNNGQEIGKLDFNGPALVFTGDAEESAKVFIDWVARNFAARLEEERKVESEACWRLCDALWIEEGKDAHDCREAIRARGNT